MNEKAELLNAILHSADKHPNSRVSKLIRNVEADCTQKNIVLLLIELAEHSEYATDFNISLKYYLQEFERLGVGRDIVLNEAGLLLLNSSKIYARRVDYVQELVERQILTLSNADSEIAEAKKQQETNTVTVEKPKRGRKRLLEAPKDPYEVELMPKKLRKITRDKRFASNNLSNACKAKAAVAAAAVALQARQTADTEQHIHPAGWLHSSIVDFENEEEIDSKRNYKLFTYHVEHRYNTLVPDINFRLHFMMKDYIDEEAEKLEEASELSPDAGAGDATSWPPLSDAYVEQYLNLENRILGAGGGGATKKRRLQCSSVAAELITAASSAQQSTNEVESALNLDNVRAEIVSVEQSAIATVVGAAVDAAPEVSKDVAAVNDVMPNDSALGESINVSLDSSINVSLDSSKNALLDSSNNGSLDNSINASVDSGINASLDNSINASVDSGINASLDNSINASVDSGINASLHSNINTTLDSCENATLDSNVNALLNTTQNAENTAENDADINKVSVDASPKEAPAENSNNNSLSETQNDSGLGSSLLDSSANNTTIDVDSTLSNSLLNSSVETTTINAETANLNNPITNESIEIVETSTALNVDHTCSIEQTSVAGIQRKSQDSDISKCDSGHEDADENKINLPATDKSHDDTQINLNEIKILMPHLDDEGVFFSDLDEQELRMLTPTILTKDMFPHLEDKHNFTIHIDEEIISLLQLSDKVPEHFTIDDQTADVPPLKLNIMKLPEKQLRKRLLFKLAPEFDAYMKARLLKRKGTAETQESRQPKQIKLFNPCVTINEQRCVSPAESDFCGFSDIDEDEFYGFDNEEDESQELVIAQHRLSRDSGVGVEPPLTPVKNRLSTIDEEPTSAVKLAQAVCQAMANSETNNEETSTTMTTPPTNETENVANNDLDATTAAAAVTNDDNTTITTNDAITDTNSTEVITTNIVETADLSDNTVSNSLDNTVDNSLEDNCIAGNLADNTLVDKCLSDESTDVDEGVEDSAQMLEQVQLECEATKRSKALDSTLDDIEFNNSKSKIQKWHEHLQPILAKSRERHHFDVFQIGTEIMQNLQNASSIEPQTDRAVNHTNCISFQDVMNAKDASYVSRYFLSSLLLANQSNVKIAVHDKSVERPAEWSDIKFELLSTKRHTVSIEDDIGMVHTKPKSTAAEQIPTTSKAAAAKLKKAKNKVKSTPLVSFVPETIAVVTPVTAAAASTPVQQQLNDFLNVNLDFIRPLKQIQKVPTNSDDYDSGIFSCEELL